MHVDPKIYNKQKWRFQMNKRAVRRKKKKYWNLHCCPKIGYVSVRYFHMIWAISRHVEANYTHRLSFPLLSHFPNLKLYIGYIYYSTVVMQGGGFVPRYYNPQTKSELASLAALLIIIVHQTAAVLCAFVNDLTCLNQNYHQGHF